MTHLNNILSAANWPPPEIALDIASDEIERLLSRIELLEGYLEGALNTIEAFVACDTKDARAALEAKP
jgi:hypothetical protein